MTIYWDAILTSWNIILNIVIAIVVPFVVLPLIYTAVVWFLKSLKELRK